MKQTHHGPMDAFLGSEHIIRVKNPYMGSRAYTQHLSAQAKPLVNVAGSKTFAAYVKPVTASTLILTSAASLHSQSDGSDPPPEQASLSKMSVLLVEDNRANQMLATQLLEGEGARVMLAENGEQALARLKDTDKHFDVVLMDIQMPVMDGYQATREIRQTLGLTQLPIIGMSANALQSDCKAAFAVGMNDYIGKPFELDFLVEKLIQLCHGDSLPSVGPPVHSNTQPNGEQTHREDNALLNVATSVERFSGNMHIYQRALAIFIEDSQRLLATLPKCLTEVNHADMLSSLHSIKGMAANLGAEAVATLCKKMEMDFALSEAASCVQASYQRSLAQLQGGLLATCKVILQQLTDKPFTSQSQPGTLQNSELPALLQQLGSLLAHSDLDALGLQQSLHERFKDLKPALFQLLDQNTKQMKFVEAEKICQQISASLQCPFGA